MPRSRSSRKSARIFKSKRLLVVFLVGLFVVASAYAIHAVQIRRQAGSLKDRAREAKAAEDWATALNLYGQYLTLQPKDVEALSEMTNCQVAMIPENPGLYKKALENFETVLIQDPGRQEDRRTLAKYYMSGNYISAAKKHLKILATANVTNTTADPELLFLLGRCEQLEGNRTGASDFYQDAIQTGQAKIETYWYLGNLLRYEVNTPQSLLRADAVMDQMVEAHSADVNSWISRSRYRYMAGNKIGAKEDIVYAYDELPNGQTNAEVVLMYAEMSLAEEDIAKAKDLLNRGHDAIPKDQRITRRLADLLVRTKDFDQARQLLRTSTEKISNTDPVLVEMADLLLDVQEEDAAKAAINRFESPLMDVNRLRGYFLGRIAAEKNEWRSAIEQLEFSVVELNRFPLLRLKAHLTLAECYGASNDLENKATSYRDAIIADPQSAIAKAGLADTLVQLGQSKEASDIYQSISGQIPAARSQLARLKFRDVLSQPPQERNWAAFQKSLGSPPYPLDMELLWANALFFQNRTPEAIERLKTIVELDQSLVRAWITLVLLQATQNINEAEATLQKAQKLAGDLVDFRLCQAQLYVRDPKAINAAGILRLAESANAFGTEDRFRLYFGLGELLAGAGQRLEALPLFQKACAEKPSDLVSRLSAFDVALTAADGQLAEKLIAEMNTIEGGDGPVTLVATITQALVNPTAPTREQLANWERDLQKALQQRKKWGRIYVLLGDLAFYQQQPAQRLEFYQKAVELGERSQSLLRRLIDLMMQQQNYREALELLAQLNTNGGLSDDLQRQYFLMQSAIGENTQPSLNWIKSREMTQSKNYRDHILRGLVLALNGDLEGGKGALNYALSLNDTAPEVWVMMVRFLSASGQKEAATAAVTRAEQKLRATGKTTASAEVIALALGECYELIGNINEAAKCYQEAAQTKTNDSQALKNLYSLLLRAGKLQEANDVLTKAMAEKNGETVRWARRVMALNSTAMTEGFRNIPDALKLMDRNLAESDSSIEDVRARAFVQARDPFQRRAALDKLRNTLSQGPMTPEQFYLLGTLQRQSGEREDAENALLQATKSGPLSAPEHLAMLAQVQIELNKLGDAEKTIKRLKLQAPSYWYTTTEEARLLAAQGELDAAAELLKKHPMFNDPRLRIQLVARVMEEIGCLKQVEELYLQTMKEAPNDPESHLPIAMFYIRQQRSQDAIALANQYRDRAPIGQTARLLSGAVRNRIPELVPEEERAAWIKTIEAIELWVSDQAKQKPRDEDLLFSLAELADSRGRYDDAIRLYRQAVDNTKTKELRSLLQNNLAVLLALRKVPGTVNEQLRLLNEAIGVRGPAAYLLDSRAMVYIAAERYDEALKELDAAIGSSPKATYYFHQAIVLEKLDNRTGQLNAIAEARRLKLSKGGVHPLQWPDFERLIEKK